MKAVITAVGASIAAAALTYLVFEASSGLDALWRWTIVVATGFVGLATALIVSKRVRTREQGGVAIASRVTSGGHLEIHGVEVEFADAGAEVGTNLRSTKNTTIRNIRVRRNAEGAQEKPDNDSN